jgi:hypothetical protein
LFQVELDGLAFSQAVKIELLQATAVEKNFLPLCGSNEPETSVPDNSLDCSLHSHLGARTWGETFSAGRKSFVGRPAKRLLLCSGANLATGNSIVKGFIKMLIV